jgi:hypothetical protein
MKVDVPLIVLSEEGSEEGDASDVIRVGMTNEHFQAALGFQTTRTGVRDSA